MDRFVSPATSLHGSIAQGILTEPPDTAPEPILDQYMVPSDFQSNTSGSGRPVEPTGLQYGQTGSNTLYYSATTSDPYNLDHSNGGAPLPLTQQDNTYQDYNFQSPRYPANGYDQTILPAASDTRSVGTTTYAENRPPYHDYSVATTTSKPNSHTLNDPFYFDYSRPFPVEDVLNTPHYMPSPAVLLHIKYVMEGICESMQHTDVTICTSEGRLRVHRAILASHSTFLR